MNIISHKSKKKFKKKTARLAMNGTMNFQFRPTTIYLAKFPIETNWLLVDLHTNNDSGSRPLARSIVSGTLTLLTTPGQG